MADRNESPAPRHGRTTSDDNTILGTGVTTRHIEAFSRKVTTTATHLIGDPSSNATYQNAMVELQKELRRPGIQQRVFSYAKASPTEMVRKTLSTSEIQHRALTYIPDELLTRIPEDENIFSLFQGFQATLPEGEESEHRKKHRRNIKGQKLLEESPDNESGTPLERLKKERHRQNHRLEMMSVRKNMCSSEIREIDNKISNLNTMRKIVLDRLEELEQDELQMEQELLDTDNRLEDLLEELDDAALLGNSPPPETEPDGDEETTEDTEADTFMSESIYQKLPSPKSKRKTLTRRKSTPIRHEHLEAGTSLRELQAHNDMITALDFDAPFGTMVTSALDDTVRVWDLNLGRCIGLLEGHQASVRCLQVEDSIVATGSMDASIRLWDLSQADYAPYDDTPTHSTIQEENEDNDGLAYEDTEAPPSSKYEPRPSDMRDCALTTLSGHVAEITALNFHGDTLVSGSADKTLRQWDLTKGRCVQTLDVLWAAAQASATINTSSVPNAASSSANGFRTTGSRVADSSADFVGALQCFDAALACGTADGMVRLWDLRSGQVHRSLVGHTGAVTCLQFDEKNLITGSADRSIRLWDLRTGSIIDAYAYNNPVTSMMFDKRRIVAAAGENVAKIYDRADGRHWDCGAGASSTEGKGAPSVVERVRVKDGYLTEGRKDGVVGIWTC